MVEKFTNWGDIVEFEERKEEVNQILKKYSGRENRKRFLDTTTSSNRQVKQRISGESSNSVLGNLVLHDNMKLKVRETVTNIAKLKNDKRFSKLLDEEIDKNCTNFNSATSTPKRKMLGVPSTPYIYENDKEVLDRRQKQIDFGKNTLGYQNYIQAIPKTERMKEHPITPKKHLKYSRRSWDTLVKIWRRELHVWDPKELNHSYEDASDISFSSTSATGNTSTSTADFDIDEDPTKMLFPELMDN